MDVVRPILESRKFLRFPPRANGKRKYESCLINLCTKDIYPTSLAKCSVPGRWPLFGKSMLEGFCILRAFFLECTSHGIVRCKFLGPI